MEWLWGATLLPFLVCGAMCVGGAVLAAVEIRRNKQAACHSADEAGAQHAEPLVSR